MSIPRTSGVKQRDRSPDREDSIELVVGAETIGVWLDESGIHFRQPGTPREGLIPWSTALAVSMLPEGAMRLGELVHV